MKSPQMIPEEALSEAFLSDVLLKKYQLHQRGDELAAAAIAKIRKSHSPAELKAKLAAFNAGREPDAGQPGLLA